MLKRARAEAATTDEALFSHIKIDTAQRAGPEHLHIPSLTRRIRSFLSNLTALLEVLRAAPPTLMETKLCLPRARRHAARVLPLGGSFCCLVWCSLLHRLGVHRGEAVGPFSKLWPSGESGLQAVLPRRRWCLVFCLSGGLYRFWCTASEGARTAVQGKGVLP